MSGSLKLVNPPAPQTYVGRNHGRARCARVVGSCRPKVSSTGGPNATLGVVVSIGVATAAMVDDHPAADPGSDCIGTDLNAVSQVNGAVADACRARIEAVSSRDGVQRTIKVHDGDLWGRVLRGVAPSSTGEGTNVCAQTREGTAQVITRGGIEGVVTCRDLISRDAS